MMWNKKWSTSKEEATNKQRIFLFIKPSYKSLKLPSLPSSLPPSWMQSEQPSTEPHHHPSHPWCLHSSHLQSHLLNHHQHLDQAIGRTIFSAKLQAKQQTNIKAIYNEPEAKQHPIMGAIHDAVSATIYQAIWQTIISAQLVIKQWAIYDAHWKSSSNPSSKPRSNPSCSPCNALPSIIFAIYDAVLAAIYHAIQGEGLLDFDGVEDLVNGSLELDGISKGNFDSLLE
jgi:hypothetical protein